MQFTITYNGNGATNGNVPVDNTAYAAGAHVTVIGNTGQLRRGGDTFARWNTKADGSGTPYGFPAPNSFTIGPSNVTLYAQWYTTAGLTNSGHGPGLTRHYAFAYEDSLKAGGLEPARTNAVLAVCETDYQIMSTWFGGAITLDSVVSVPIEISVANLGGGANATTSITLKPGSGNAGIIRYLLVSEVTEYFMDAQRRGWFAPDGSNEQSCGEALSRFLAQQFLVRAGLGVSQPGYEISPAWLNSSLPVANPSSSQLAPLTTLSSPIDGVVTSFTVAQAQTIPFATTYAIQIDSEQMLVTAVSSAANRLTVTRGYNGTAPAAHAAQAEVLHSYGSRADYVNLTLEYDHSISPASGCGMLFLYYLNVQLGFPINAIVAAAPGVNSAATCLRGVYQNLTGDERDPFPLFKRLLDEAFPPDQLSVIAGSNPDNPFPLGQLGQWHWADQGAPGDLGVNTAVGVVTVMDDPKAAQRPYVFCCGDLNLWLNWWDGANWHWTNQSAVGPQVNGAVGAVCVMDSPNSPQRPYAFVIGAVDHYLWVNWWDGRGWQWANHRLPGGHAIIGAIGVVTVKDTPAAGERPYAFVRADDGHLWVNWWDGANWHWADQGTPNAHTSVAIPVGALTVQDSPNAAQRPYAFILGTDNHLWVNWWDGAAWHWADQGTPAPGAPLGPVGVVTVRDTPASADRPYVFVHTGALYVNWWDGAAWHWADQGTPNGSFIGGPTGGVPAPRSDVVTVKDTPNSPQRPYAFVRDNNGLLWVNWWDGAAWHWANQGFPPGAGVFDLVGVCTVMDHPWDPQRPYAFVTAGSGHLWVNWWG